jgi:hypothetical protein
MSVCPSLLSVTASPIPLYPHPHFFFNLSRQLEAKQGLGMASASCHGALVSLSDSDVQSRRCQGGGERSRRCKVDQGQRSRGMRGRGHRAGEECLIVTPQGGAPRRRRHVVGDRDAGLSNANRSFADRRGTGDPLRSVSISTCGRVGEVDHSESSSRYGRPLPVTGSESELPDSESVLAAELQAPVTVLVAVTVTCPPLRSTPAALNPLMPPAGQLRTDQSLLSPPAVSISTRWCVWVRR